ncbi:MAG: ABC transporter ATP-binding protein [Anaerolineales bacterium]|nr:ABC transporter ATP-binding protein [Anaerolineales bacterium]
MAKIALPLDDISTKGYDEKIVRRLAGYVKPYTFRLIISLVLMLLNSTAAVAGPYLVKIAIDAGMEAGSVDALRRTILLYILAIFVQWFSIFSRVNIMVRVGQSIIYDLRDQLFRHLQELSLSFYSRFSVGRVITRVINDVGVLREFIVWTMLAIARDLFTLIGILIAMVSMNPRLSLITLITLPIMVVITRLFRRRARENYRRVRSAISWVNSVLAENINGVREVQAFSRQKHNYAFFRDEVNRNNLDASLKAAQIASAFPAAIDLLGGLAVALVVLFGGFAALDANARQAITPGVLVAFVLYIERFFEPIRDLSQRYDSFQSTMAGGERVFSLLDITPEVRDADDAVELPPISGEVRFENVSFHYADDPTLVLKDINLHVPAGMTVALVGKTGAGKSTLIKLIGRFHDPTTGRVLVDGYDLRKVKQHSLRSQMGIVLQDPFLFSGTVADNIRFGRLEASDEEVENAARAVGAHEFISRLRLGYDTPVEEGGVILSVGQRQLISFARALLADPRILILDEATSSIDLQTEQLIQRGMRRLLKGRTAFVIAHRLSTVVNADHIIVIEDGQIVEQGNHTQLLAKRGVYSRLYRAGFDES